MAGESLNLGRCHLSKYKILQCNCRDFNNKTKGKITVQIFPIIYSYFKFLIFNF